MTTTSRTRNLFDPLSDKAYALSRSRIDSFIECPRCFYLDRRLGIGRPSIPGYTLNNAVDELLKKEFDEYRLAKSPHPFMTKHGIDAIPFAHEELDTWRANFKGIRYHHSSTNFVITGAIDDIWQNSTGELHIVDYKATSTTSEITLDTEYRQGYKRQLEIYQWLFRRAGFPVSNIGYIVYANGLKDRARFDQKLEFDLLLIPYQGNDGWVEGVITRAHKCLCDDHPPAASANCEYCSYRGTSRAALPDEGE